MCVYLIHTGHDTELFLQIREHFQADRTTRTHIRDARVGGISVINAWLTSIYIFLASSGYLEA